MNIGISQDGSKTVIFTRADAIDLLIDAADEDNMPRPTEILREGFKGFSQMTNEELASDIRVFWAAVVDLLVDEFDDALALPMTADAMLDPSIAIRVDADPPWRFDGFTAPCDLGDDE